MMKTAIPQTSKKTLQSMGSVMGKYGVYIAFVALFLILSLSTKAFFTTSNITNIFKQISVIGIIAVGMTFVIVTGGIDLSVGAIVALSACMATSFAQKDTTHPLIFAYMMGLLMGLACGACSGFFITVCNIPPFIATLATTQIARGLTFVYTNGRPITGLTDAYRYIGRQSIGIVPVAVIILLVIAVLGIFLLNFTKFGRHVFAVGGNEKSALVSGINTRRVKFYCYLISGALAACAGILLSSRIQTGQPAGGDGYELDAITAVVIGGASLSGGSGNVFGAIIGMLIIGIMTNGLDLLNVSSYYQQVIKGIIILLAVLSDRKKFS